MEAWIGEVCSLANHLITINVPTSDEDIVVLTAGLPPSYGTVIISLYTVTPTELMLNFVITYLLNEESHQNLPHPITTPKPEQKSAEEAIVAMRKE
ncbi:hypothetical protein H0H87_003595, partial [Tephrocybe sp. NHM501043]